MVIDIGKHLPFELYLVSFVLHLEIVLLMMFFLAMLDCQKVYPCWAAMLVVILFGSHVECDLWFKFEFQYDRKTIGQEWQQE